MQNRLYEASLLLMWILRHIKLLFCMNASIAENQPPAASLAYLGIAERSFAWL